MNDSPTQQTTGKIDALLISSISRYQDILTLIAAMSNDTGDKNPAILDSRGTKILQLQEQAALADHELITIIEKMDPAVLAHLAAHPLMQQRQDIIQQILIYNRSLISTINNIKTLLAHEIKAMQGGRVALQGYRQTTSLQNGAIVNDSH